jgi:hypothetical protein
MSTSAERMRRFRERQAAAGVPLRAPGPRDAGELLGPAVAETIQALELQPEDAAVAQLARRYAAVMDETESPGWAARWIAPLLLVTLDSLGATPAARSRMKSGKPEPHVESALDRLRAARRN